MADAIWLDVLPSMGKFGKNLIPEAKKAGASAGAAAGKAYNRGFTSSSKDVAANKVKELESAQRSASGLVRKLAGDVSKARQKADRDTASQIDAETRLARAVERFGEDSAQAESAQLRLNAAREKARASDDAYQSALKGLKDAKSAEKSATADLEKAQRDLTNEVGKSPKAWERFKRNLTDTGGAADHARRRLDQLKGAAKKAGKVVGTGLLAAGTAAVGTVAAVGGLAIKGGLDRALNIEDAQASLRGIGHDAQSVEKIMDSALASVKGTSFGLGDAATIAATAVAAGITPGEKLTDTLTLTANAAALARTGLDEMGSILNKVWTSGRVSTEELNQLGDRGIPIWTALAEAYGVSGTELRKMVSQGKVDAETFAEVLEGTVGSAAEEMGKTTRGQWANMMAALSRTGESFINGILPLVKTGMAGLTDLFDQLGPTAEKVGQAVGTWLGEKAMPVLEKMISWLTDVGIPALVAFGDYVGTTIVPKVADFAREAGEVLVPAIQRLGEFLMESVWPALQNVGEWIVKNRDWLAPLVVAVGAGVIAYEAWAISALAAEKATKLFGRQGKIATGIQTAWNAVMAANPLMIVLIAVTALAAGLTYFFTQTETGRKAWAAFTDFLSSAWETVSGFFVDSWEWIKQAWTTGVDVVSGAWEGFIGFFVSAWTDHIRPAWEGFTGALQHGYETYIKPVFDGARETGEGVWKALEPVFTWLGEAAENWGNNFKWVYENVINPVATAIAGAFTWLAKGVIGVIVGYIVWHWTTLTKVVTGAWNNVIKPMLAAFAQGFVDLWNYGVKPVIGFIVAGWHGLVAGIKWVWETILRPAITAVGKGFVVLWDATVKPVLRFLQQGWDALVRGIQAAWNSIGKPIIDGVGTAMKFLWERAFKPTIGYLTRSWDGFVRGLKTLWNKFGKPAIDLIMNVIKGDFPAAFETGRDLVRNVWESIANIARKPINFVINTVYNDGLKKLFDGVASALGLSWKLPAVSPLPAFAKGGEMKDGWKLVGEEGPELIHTGPGYVYTAKETKAMLQGRTQAPEGSLDMLAGAQQSDAVLPVGGFWDSIKSGAAAVWDTTKDIAGAVKDWTVGKIAEGIKAVTGPLKDGIRKFIPGDGFPGLVREGSIKLIDDMTAFASKKDEEAAIKQAAEGTNAIYDGPMGRFHRPSRGPFTSMYGPRWGGWHAGVDIAGGGPTYAALDGIVQRVGWNILTGRTGIGILLNHAKDFWTYYGHNPSMGAVKVRPGDRVKGGQHIGAQGATGNVTGVHLHFETHRGAAGRDVNPMPYLRDKGGVLPPGLSWVLNNTGSDEWVFNKEQLARLEQFVNEGRDRQPTAATGGDQHFHIHNPGASGDDIARAIARKDRRNRKGV